MATALQGLSATTGSPPIAQPIEQQAGEEDNLFADNPITTQPLTQAVQPTEVQGTSPVASIQAGAPAASTGIGDYTGIADSAASDILKQSATEAEKARTAALVGTESYDPRSAAAVQGASGVQSATDVMKKAGPQATVAGQLTALLNKDSEYMEQAKKYGLEQAASQGLMGSTMAVGAAYKEAIAAGLPIAQQDAETYAKSVLAEQDTYNAISKNIADGVVTADLKHYTNTLDQAMANKNTQMNILMDAAQQSNNTIAQGALTQMSKSMDHFSQVTMGNLESKLKIALQDKTISHEQAMQTQNLTAQIIAGTQAEMMQMMQDPDFVSSFLGTPSGTPPYIIVDGEPDYTQPNYTDEDYAAAYAEMIDFMDRDIMGPAKSSANFVAASAGIDIGDILDLLGV